jgi:KipI family sensor histidine kinase inhibitor
VRFEVLPVGDAGLLVSLADARHVGAAFRALAARLDGARDVVPGASSVLVAFEDAARVDEASIRRALENIGSHDASASRLLEVPVRYDGPDLRDVASRAGLSTAEAAARHAAVEYVVAFVGFRPGFPYLTGLPPELATPRRATPRPRVPSGSVAIGAVWAGIYPAATPGGWNLIGTTDTVLFDVRRDPPALFSPGDRVRFVPL